MKACLCTNCGITANVLTCLKKYGRPPKELGCSISACHMATCSICGEKKLCTEARDFFFPDFELIDEVVRYFEKTKKLEESIEKGEALENCKLEKHE